MAERALSGQPSAAESSAPSDDANSWPKAALVYAKPLQLYDLLRDLFLVWIKPTTHVKWRFSPRTLELTRRALTARDTIVIGTSCGGVAALTELLGGLPGELSASVLIVMHTSPDSPRLLADILARCTTLKVAYGQHGHSVEPGHVYIAPPDYHMTVLCPGVVRLDQGPKVRFSRPTVDPLFRTAAEVYGPRVIGVVLTGYGEDGTDGLRAINAAGGITVVQDPNEATAAGMPRSALLGVRPDFNVSLSVMAALLVRHVIT